MLKIDNSFQPSCCRFCPEEGSEKGREGGQSFHRGVGREGGEWLSCLEFWDFYSCESTVFDSSFCFTDMHKLLQILGLNIRGVEMRTYEGINRVVEMRTYEGFNRVVEMCTYEGINRVVKCVLMRDSIGL